MFCRNCGQPVPDESAFCAKCGTSIAPSTSASSSGTATAAAPAPSKIIGREVKERTKDAWKGIKLFAQSPVGGLKASFDMLEPSRALSIGLIFGLLYEVFLFWGLYRIADNAALAEGMRLPIGEMTAKQMLQIAFVGVIPFLTLAAAGGIARKIFRGQGSIPGDVYTAGASLLPIGIFVFAASILGAANVEVIVALWFFAATYTVLMLYAGCARIAGMPEAGAAPAVPIMLMLSAWLTKVVIVAVFTPANSFPTLP
jgi:hypothetical protein